MPHHYPKRSQYRYTKKPCRVRNWPDYETALRKRGDLTLWFCEEAIQAWHAPASLKPGGQRIYSDLAIETALTVRSVYHLGLRQTEGFLESVCIPRCNKAPEIDENGREWRETVGTLCCVSN